MSVHTVCAKCFEEHWPEGREETTKGFLVPQVCELCRAPIPANAVRQPRGPLPVTRQAQDRGEFPHCPVQLDLIDPDGRHKGYAFCREPLERGPHDVHLARFASTSNDWREVRFKEGEKYVEVSGFYGRSSSLSLPPTGDGRRGDWFQTWSGVQYWPADPRPDDVRFEDIAQSLSGLPRFLNHTLWSFYVGYHSILVAIRAVPPPDVTTRADEMRFRAAGLLHDSAEAYLGDQTRPAKRSLPDYRALEVLNEGAIFTHFGLVDVLRRPTWLAAIKSADNRSLYTERRDLLVAPAPAEWTDAQGDDAVPWPDGLETWPRRHTRAAFWALGVDLGLASPNEAGKRRINLAEGREMLEGVGWKGLVLQ